jgi:hypothetical protein
MDAELDHVFVCCDIGAPEAALLAGAGLVEGSGNTHPGQGTANRRFFFANAYLELMWVSDPAEAQCPAALPTQLWEHWSGRAAGACPFGIVFRPRAGSIAQPPFASWSYRPSYLPDGLSIDVGLGMALAEPQFFYLPFARRPGSSQLQPTTHPAGIGRITHVGVSLPSAREASPALARAIELGLLTVRHGLHYLLELGFDGPGTATVDLRPGLPLLFVPRLTHG